MFSKIFLSGKDSSGDFPFRSVKSLPLGVNSKMMKKELFCPQTEWNVSCDPGSRVRKSLPPGAEDPLRCRVTMESRFQEEFEM